MIVKIIKGRYWYAKMVGAIFEVEDHTKNDFLLTIDKNEEIRRLIGKKDCRPLELLKAAKRATNKQMAAALWKRLKYRNEINTFPYKTEWLPVTRKRLNSAVKAVTKA